MSENCLASSWPSVNVFQVNWYNERQILEEAERQRNMERELIFIN
jgi:hypothetical protein